MFATAHCVNFENDQMQLCSKEWRESSTITRSFHTGGALRRQALFLRWENIGMYNMYICTPCAVRNGMPRVLAKAYSFFSYVRNAGQSIPYTANIVHHLFHQIHIDRNLMTIPPKMLLIYIAVIGSELINGRWRKKRRFTYILSCSCGACAVLLYLTSHA